MYEPLRICTTNDMKIFSHALKRQMKDGEDIALILNEMISLPETLDKKIHAAQTRGSFYINSVTGNSKINT